MTPLPEGQSVPEGFRLPWNTTRTMADVWGLSADEIRKAHAKREHAAIYRRYIARSVPPREAADDRR